MISKVSLSPKRITVAKKTFPLLHSPFLFTGGTDIDVWTYEQLVDLVREYKLLKRQVQTQSNFNRTFSKQSSFQNQDIGTPKSLVTVKIMLIY